MKTVTVNNMKRIYLLIGFFICTIYSFAQFPVNQTIGAPGTQVYSRGGLGSDSGFIFRTNWSDTSTASRGFLKNIPGIVIRTGDILWYRNQSATSWVQVANGSGGLFARTDARNNTGSNMYFSAADNSFTLDSIQNFNVTTTAGSMNFISAGGITLQSDNASTLAVNTTEVAILPLDSMKLIYQTTTPTLSTLGDYKFQVRSPAGGFADYTGNFETNDSLFAVQDNLFTANRRTNMQNFRLNLDSGEVVIRGDFNTPSDSVFVVKNGTGFPILRVDNVASKVSVHEFGAYSNTFSVNGAAAVLTNGYPFSFNNSAFIQSFQQPLRLSRAWPQTGSEIIGTLITNDTFGVQLSIVDTPSYIPFQVSYRSRIDNQERVKFLIKQDGSVYSNSYPSGSGGSTDSALVVKNGIVSSVPFSTLGGSGFTFQDSLQWIWASNYGVVYDGVTDNASALKSIASAQRSLRRPVVFGPGTIYSSDSVTWNNATLIGYNTTIKSTSNTVTIFNVQDSCDVSGFKFIGNGRAAALPGGVFTTQDGIRIFGNKNRVHDNWFTSMNGSGVNIWAGGCCGYRNVVNDNTFMSNTIGIFAMTNSEYLDAYGNKGEFNYVGIYDRSSSNNRWWGNEFSYSLHSNFRLLGNGDHGGAWNNTFNHGSSFNVYIESCTLNYVFSDNISYTGNIAFGSAGVVNNFNWNGGTVSGATITQTGSNVSNVVMQNFTEGSTANTYSATGVIYKNVLNNSAIPDRVGGDLVGSMLIFKSTEANGTATGTALRMTGGNDGATTLWEVANNGNIGSGFAPTSGFKQIIKSLTSSGGSVHTLFRNSSDHALLQISDLGDVRFGNQTLTTSVNNFYNKNFIGGNAATIPTAWAHFPASTTAANTASLKIIEGSRQTTPEDGTVNYVSNNLEFTETSTVFILAKTLTNTATLDFDLTAVNYQDLTVTVTGAAVDDAVSIAVDPAAMVADVTYFATVTAANTVTIRCSRVGGGGAANPASGTFRAVVVRY